MSRTPSPLIRRAEEVEYETVDAADGLSKGVLIDESRGAPNFAIRRFTRD
ncbi:MAG: cupin domain-containing protein, partial [Halobacteriales archaeon]